MPPRLRSPTPTCAHAVMISALHQLALGLDWCLTATVQHLQTASKSSVCPALQGGLVAVRRASECRRCRRASTAHPGLT